MHVPKPQPQEPSPGRVLTPGPARRVSALDRRLAADEAARASRPDLVVRFDVAAPDRADLTDQGLDPAAVAWVETAESHRAGLGQRAAEARGFGVELARRPDRAVSATDLAPPHGATTELGDRIAGVRFEVPAWPADGTQADGGTLATLALLRDTMSAATANDAAWAALRADPEPTVRASANAFPWSAHGLVAGSAEAASLTGAVIEQLRVAFGLASPGHAPWGPAVPDVAVVAPPFDPGRIVTAGRTVRVSLQGV